MGMFETSQNIQTQSSQNVTLATSSAANYTVRTNEVPIQKQLRRLTNEQDNLLRNESLFIEVDYKTNFHVDATFRDAC